MTKDEIIRMAREAGFVAGVSREHWGDVPFVNLCLPTLERHQTSSTALFGMLNNFAALVAEAERQRLHDKFMHIHHAQQHSNNYWHFAARKILEQNT